MIVESGNAAFSQFTMSHPINLVLEKTDKSGIGRMWAPIDVVFLDAMEELIILDIKAGIKVLELQREIESYKDR